MWFVVMGFFQNLMVVIFQVIFGFYFIYNINFVVIFLGMVFGNVQINLYLYVVGIRLVVINGVRDDVILRFKNYQYCLYLNLNLVEDFMFERIFIQYIDILIYIISRLKLGKY